ncbi:MAG: hypothetical protein GY758_09555, partial [Fuerstiella sp.]|nr:hypothetical protein [Fuerstiella sp.]
MGAKRLFFGLWVVLLNLVIAENYVCGISADDSRHSSKNAGGSTTSHADADSPTNSRLVRTQERGSRTFRFNYKASVDELPVGARVRVWIPLPQAGDHQKVEMLVQDLPVEGSINTEPTYGNRILYCESSNASGASLPFSVAFLIRRQEVRGIDENPGPIRLTDQQRQRFLSANAKVPLKGKRLDLLGGLKFSGDSLEVARTLYNRVDDHVRYDKTRPG